MKQIHTRKTPITRPLTGEEIRACEARVLGTDQSDRSDGPVGGLSLNGSHPENTPRGCTGPHGPQPPKGVCGSVGVVRCYPSPSPLTKNKVVRTGTTGPKPHKNPLLTIIEDVKEKTPLKDWPEGVEVVRKNLHTGDYSIEGWENCFTIERKSLEDLAGTMLGDYESSSEKPKKRFNRELERMRHFDCKAVVVTASPQEVIDFRHHCGMDAHAALWGFGLSVFANYGIPVFFLGDEKTAARWVADLAKHYIVCRTKKNFTKEDRSAKALGEWLF